MRTECRAQYIHRTLTGADLRSALKKWMCSCALALEERAGLVVMEQLMRGRP